MEKTKASWEGSKLGSEYPCKKRMGNSQCPSRTWRTQSAYPTAESCPAQQRRCEKRASARATQGGAQNVTAEATAEDATEEPMENDGPNNRVEK